MQPALKLLLVLMALWLGTAQAAEKNPERNPEKNIVPQLPVTQALPAELAHWIPWLEKTQPQRDCPKQNDQAHCLFPSSLKIELLSARELRFEMLVYSTAHGAEKIALPGNAEHWPQDLQMNGKPVAVAGEGKKPVLWIPGAGAWLVKGVISAPQALPQTLEIPREAATVRLIERGAERSVVRPEAGVLALSQIEAASSGAERAFEATVFRKISDGQVTLITTVLRLKISGVERGLEFDGFLPAGAEWVNIESDLPWEIRPGGRLWLKLRPGVHEVGAQSRVASPLAGLIAPTWAAAGAPEFQVPQEVWMFEPAANLRQVAVEGLQSIDPSRMELPEGFDGLQTYAAKPGMSARFVQRVRGREGQDLKKLSAQREIWIDFAGGHATSREQLRFALPARERLEWNGAAQLKEAAIGDTPALITQGASGKTGFALPQGQGEAIAVSRLPVTAIWDVRAFPAATALDNLQVQFNLPPGYRALWIEDAQTAQGFWLNGMTTLDWFALILSALIARRLFKTRIGVALAFALLFARLYGGVPIQAWLWALVFLALAKALPDGWFRVIPRFIAGLLLLGLGLLMIPWSIDRAQQALHRSMDEPLSVAIPRPYPAAAAAPERMQEEMADERMDKLSSVRSQRAQKPYYQESAEPADLQQASGAKAILSEGIPDWHWHTVTASWNTPVASNKLVRIGLMPPWLGAIVGVLSAAGIWWTWLMAVKLLWGMGPLALPARPPKPPKPPKIKQPEPNQEVAA